MARSRPERHNSPETHQHSWQHGTGVIGEGKPGTNSERRGRLEHLTGVIKRGEQAFIKTGEALAEVRGEGRGDGLYEGVYEDWDTYCREEFKYSGRHADRTIRASRAATTLGPFGLDIRNEAQARVMARLMDDPATAKRIWDRVGEETGGKQTAEKLARAVRREIGTPSPDPYFDMHLEEEEGGAGETPRKDTPRPDTGEGSVSTEVRGRPAPPRMGGVPRPMLRYYGSKWNLAPFIAELFVDHRVYVEPYLGSAAVFMSKEPVRFEVLNDLDDEIVNLFEMIRTRREEIAGMVRLTPYSETEVRLAGETLGDADAALDPAERARRFLVVSHQARRRQVGELSYSAATGPTARDNVSLWKRVPGNVWPVADRFRDADIRNRDAIEVVRENAYEDALVYADPPYVPGTRAPKLYRHETPLEHHEKLVQALVEHPGPVYLSGYKNDLYEQQLEGRGWVARKMDDPPEGKEPEYLWLNAKAQVGAARVDARRAKEKAEAEKRRRRTPQQGMGMMYTPSEPEPEVKPEVALFGALIGAYLEEE